MKGTTTTTTQMRVQQCVDTIHRSVVVYNVMHDLVIRACIRKTRQVAYTLWPKFRYSNSCVNCMDLHN